MKRLWIALLCLALCAPWTAGLSEEAQAEGGSGDFSYELMGDGAARITGYSGEGGALEIPAELDGYPVTVIRNHSRGRGAHRSQRVLWL